MGDLDEGGDYDSPDIFFFITNNCFPQGKAYVM